MADASALLASLETAISGFLANGAVEAYTADGFSVTRTNLDSMMAVRDRLKVEAASDGSGSINRFVPGRR